MVKFIITGAKKAVCNKFAHRKESYMLCNICPRSCNVDRSKALGFCNMGNRVKLARAALHFWEEPCISGSKGSGTVFFSGCNMGCVYCQNKEISTGGFGKIVTVERLAQIFTELAQKGAININLVTPTHFTHEIISAVKIARNSGMTLPIVYNTSGFEKAETIKLLKGTVDIYLPDFKYFDDDTAQRYSKAKGYTAFAKEAIDEMINQTGECVFDTEGILQKGTIVRVLVLPALTQNAKATIEYLYKKYGDKIFISIMSQYTPCTDLSDFLEIDCKLTQKEYDEVIDFACDLGLENGFIQEGDAAKESFIPMFDAEGV